MKVKEIVLSAAESLGLGEGVSAFFDGGDPCLQREAELLLAGFNRVERSLALEYLPLYAEDELLTVDDEVEYSALTYAPVRILGVENGAGESVPYKLYPRYLKAVSGKIKVTYTYTPNAKTVDDDSDFTLPSVLEHGTLAEYCLSEGRLAESAVWEQKYKQEIEGVFRGKKYKRLRSRRWV